MFNVVEPKISIGIPVYFGKPYILHCLNSILNIDYLDVEILVSVDFDDSFSKQILSKIQDSRLRIVYQPTKLTMAENYEWLINNLEGQWITVLGQDDGIMPNFFSEFEFLINEFPKINAFSFPRSYFFWPGCENTYGDTVLNFLSGRGRPKVVNPKLILIKNLLGLAEHYELPQIYTNNIIRRESVNKIKTISSGQFYWEPTPDVYSGVVIALNEKQIVKHNTSIFWTGTSPSSSGYQISKSISHLSSKSQIELVPQAYNSREGKLKYDERIGWEFWYFALDSTIYSLSALLTYLKFSNNGVNNFWRKRNIIYLAFISLLIRKLFRFNILKVKNVKLFIREYRYNFQMYQQFKRRNDLSILILSLFSIFCMLVQLSSGTVNFVKSIFRKLFLRKVRIISKNRTRYPNLTALNLYFNAHN